MAAVEITISGVLYDKINRTQQAVVLIGDASITGLGVGGGPIFPGDKPPGGGNPPGIWGGPIDPYPGHPLPQPPGLWPGQRPPHPAHPIVLPPDRPTDPPIDPPTEPPTQPADPAWSWCWNPNTGWIPAFVAGDKPQPPGGNVPPLKK